MSLWTKLFRITSQSPGSGTVHPATVSREGSAAKHSAAASESSPATLQNLPFEDEVNSFTQLLRQHLQRVLSHKPQFASFLKEAFSDDRIGVLARHAANKMMSTVEDGNPHSVADILAPVCYYIGTVPAHLSDARTWFLQKHGGYAKLLENSAANFGAMGSFKVLCHIIYGGKGTDRWVHLSILPESPDIGVGLLLPVDFITREEAAKFGWESDVPEGRRPAGQEAPPMTSSREFARPASKKCAVCGSEVEVGLIECPQCGSGRFASEKVLSLPITGARPNGVQSYPKCSSCGVVLGSKGSILGSAQVVTTGSKSAQDLVEDNILYRGSVCFTCKAVFCMKCNPGLRTCPKCHRDTEPAFRDHLRRLSLL